MNESRPLKKCMYVCIKLIMLYKNNQIKSYIQIFCSVVFGIDFENPNQKQKNILRKKQLQWMLGGSSLTCPEKYCSTCEVIFMLDKIRKFNSVHLPQHAQHLSKIFFNDQVIQTVTLGWSHQLMRSTYSEWNTCWLGEYAPHGSFPKDTTEETTNLYNIG